MSEQTVWERLRGHGVVPVIAIESVDAALPLADALIAGGLPVAEITFRTEAAGEVIALLSRERPDLLVGAGTVLTPENAEAAKECGAQFAVAPGFNPVIVNRANDIGLPFVPGVCTPSDIEGALALGCKTLKFFPAEASGGVAMLKALAGPYAHTGVRFVPTGGVNMDNLESWLASPVVNAVGGTWLAKGPDLDAGNWFGIEERCRKAAATVAKARG
jgi:2-dehydro-3-deoxyphosphogluconate aldolase / (4S)-4-hydroxy-2-oxoglutarate aldolase